MNHGSLFSGIGGFDLASQWCGWDNVFQVEYNEFCQKVLEKNFPNTDKMYDIRDVTKERLALSSTITYFSNKFLEEYNMGKKRNPKYEQSVEMYNRGLSIQDLADYFLITRQAMWKILNIRGCCFRPQRKIGIENNFYRGGKVMNKRAQRLVEKAIKKGVLVQQNCEECNKKGLMSDGRSIVQAHHDDYNYPLKVRWLCQECHYEWHKFNKAIKIKGEPEESASGTIDIVSGGFP